MPEEEVLAFLLHSLEYRILLSSAEEGRNNKNTN